MPKYSIIIPVYNAEKYLQQCVESILNQSNCDFELLLIDDYSTDTSLHICREYALAHTSIKVFPLPKNSGVSAARNFGIQQACGTYVIFVDSDDFVAPNYFKKIDDAVNEGKFDLISWGNYDYVDHLQEKAEIKTSTYNYFAKEPNPSSESWCGLFLKSFFASSCNKTFSLSILKQNNIQFDTDCVCYEDYIFNVDYCKYVRSFYVMDTPLYYYRQIEQVNPILKRKWGTRFAVSRKVANATDAFIRLHHNEQKLKDLRRYVYHAFMVELQFAYLTDTASFADAATEALSDLQYQSAVCSIRPAGKFLTMLKLAIKWHLNKVGVALLRKKIS